MTTRLTTLVRGGRLFYGSTTVLSLDAVSNEWIAATLENPAGSGKNLFLYEVVVYANSTLPGSGFVKVLLSPDTNLPSTSRTPRNANAGSAVASVANLKADAQTDQMSGGTDNEMRLRIAAGRTVVDLPPLIIPQTGIMGITNVTQSGSSIDVAFTAYWWEEDA